jgi:G3E family GTPase
MSFVFIIHEGKEVFDMIITIDRGCVVCNLRKEAKETFNNLNTTTEQDRLFNLY